MKLSESIAKAEAYLHTAKADFEAIPAELLAKTDDELAIIFHHIFAYFGYEAPKKPAPAPVVEQAPAAVPPDAPHL